MRILVVTDNYLPNMDGVVASIVNSSKRLAERGHKIFILTTKYDAPYRDEKIKDVKIHRFKSIPFPSYESYRICLPSIGKINSIIKSFRPDVMHIHTLPGVLAGTCLVISRTRRIPVVATYHASFPDVMMYASPVKLLKIDKFIEKVDSRVKKYIPEIAPYDYPAIKKVQENIKKLDVRFSALVGRLKEKSTVLIFGNNEPISRKVVWTMTNNIFNRADLVIAPSDKIKHELVIHKIKPKVVVVSNGLELDMFRRKKDTDVTVPRFLHVGRLGYEKKTSLVIEAFAMAAKKYPDARLSIVGDGPAMSLLRNQVSRLGIDEKVRFYGFLPRDKLPGIYRVHDVFVTASEMETQGLVLIEAMASGLPAIGVNALAVPDVVHSNINGFVCRRGDYRGIAKKMIYFIENPGVIRKMSENARKEAEKHDILHTIDHLEIIYSSMQESR